MLAFDSVGKWTVVAAGVHEESQNEQTPTPSSPLANSVLAIISRATVDSKRIINIFVNKDVYGKADLTALLPGPVKIKHLKLRLGGWSLWASSREAGITIKSRNSQAVKTTIVGFGRILLCSCWVKHLVVFNNTH
ncbi:hypothetical protein HPP92_028694 [Vanilla planifolia]|uniref:Uncharacterized protein n=1 Tax=Vanilla planifolia TaxID=51239 RepID=A0A835U270_VANPL|nr:hypothetical protein HPP92_028694 [Vanilla planifolia]KAG0446772.1 hypothetical protein HPP92_028680 [Vanilla planifolia]